MIIFEESAALPGKETFGGVQKVFVFLNEHLPKTNQKVYEFPMVLEQKVFAFPMILIDFQKMHVFKFKRFLNAIRKVYEMLMILKQEKSLGVMGFA